MQVYGVQCFNPTGSQKHFRLSYENGDEIKSQTNGKEKERERMLINLIIKLISILIILFTAEKSVVHNNSLIILS